MLPEPIPTWTGVVVRLLVATALGAALATASALQLGVPDHMTHADPAARVIQGIVAGIGFIGGGVILHAENRDVKGLTTAASIFVAATLGISCGIGRWRVAVVAAAITLALLTLGRPLEAVLHRVQRKNGPTPPPQDKRADNQ